MYFTGQPEPTVDWYNGTHLLNRVIGVPTGRHVVVNRLEIPQVTRDAYNTTLQCLATNTKMIAPTERMVLVDMLCK